MNQNSHLVDPNPHEPCSLPDWCYTVLPYSSALIVVKRGVSGYGQLRNSTNDPQKNRELARSIVMPFNCNRTSGSKRRSRVSSVCLSW